MEGVLSKVLFYFPLVIITNLKCNGACFMHIDEPQFYEISN